MARIYVGTYAKYNSGSIKGAWLDLEDYSDRDEFYAAANELHADESDPELMFQDWEDIPDSMVSESHVDAEVWEWLELDEDDRNILAAYREGVDSSGTFEQARDAFMGTARDEEDFAQNYADEIGATNDGASWPHSCIDWERAARELFMDLSGVEYGGQLYVFNNN